MESVLSVTGVGEKSRVEISGTPKGILFNWVVLTNSVSETLYIAPEELACRLPLLLKNYKENVLSNAIKYDLAAIQREMGGGEPR